MLGVTDKNAALNVEVQRKWADQYVRRFVETRSNKQ